MKHHLTTTSLNTTKPEEFFNRIREYLIAQTEPVYTLYLDPALYEYFANTYNYFYFTFDGTMWMHGHRGGRVILKREPHEEDTTPPKTRHILISTQISGFDLADAWEIVDQHITPYINKQHSFIECIYLDDKMFDMCLNGFHNRLKHSFDYSKMWVNGRWGQTPLVRLPEELAVLV